ncbi:MAG: large conductance mechanosensitive channel protein MscL [Eubacterium sp.]|nr:large conductance mechanosensitive channel protein MscL [Eubacterium sp.]
MKKFMEEFKKFALKGNMIDLAVGMIIGSAFTGIVGSLVNDIFMPVLSLLTGRIDFSRLMIVLGSGENAATINYGTFITQVINFLIISMVVFIMIRQLNKLERLGKKEEVKEETEKECPYCKTKISIHAVRCPHCTSILEETETKD